VIPRFLRKDIVVRGVKELDADRVLNVVNNK